ncbi:MAG: MerR family transcriptional regulator [Pseudomonadota bacterium]|nr:MerR family transcriptional regulator [Pseudomonadota bacterium]
MNLSEKDVPKQVQGVSVTRLRRWIKRGWVSPALGESGYSYSDVDIARIDLIRQLRDDLSVDAEALPVLLSLIDQVYGLRRELRCVMRAIEEQPETVRAEIVARIHVERGD